ncbi:hypothetical protein AGMMS50284_0210 [Clostridia bacterium]|nr:hypothetical protein AGMMS50284_0210 [Clostridia bacterium]
MCTFNTTESLQNEITYELTSKIVNIKYNGMIRIWGILGYCCDAISNNVIQMVHFEDVSDSCDATVKIIKALRKYQVSLDHMEAIIEDFLICGL